MIGQLQTTPDSSTSVQTTQTAREFSEFNSLNNFIKFDIDSSKNSGRSFIPFQARVWMLKIQIKLV